MAMVQSLVCLSIVFLWPEMYFNKYGEYSTEKTEVAFHKSGS